MVERNVRRDGKGFRRSILGFLFVVLFLDDFLGLRFRGSASFDLCLRANLSL